MIRIILISFSLIFSQSLDVTFKYVESPNDDFVRVFVPGTMPEGSSNDWGPNSNGFINPDASFRCFIMKLLIPMKKLITFK